MNRRSAAVVVLGLLASLAVVPLAPAAAIGPAACARFVDDLRQWSSPTTGAEIVSRTGADASTAPAGFSVDKGVLAKVAAAGGQGLSGVWRLQRGTDLVWAAEGARADALVTSGYVKRSIDFYASAHPRRCLTPVHRFQRNGVHRMATPRASAALSAAGWVKGPVAFYAVAHPRLAAAGSTDTRFAFAVLPDTQRELIQPTDPRFGNRISWLVRKKGELDLRYALQVGDLVDWGHVDPGQLTRASDQLRILESAMPWAAAVGNHDTAAVCAGGSACPGADTSRTVRDTTAYNRTFPTSRFPDLGGTFEPGKLENSFRTFSAGGASWLVLSVELWPRPAAVTWARSVVQSHPRHNVIVLTHDYLQADGTIGGGNGGYGATSPRYLFDNLIKAYPNIRIVLSGHVGDSAVRTDVGVHGNKVLSLLQTFHSLTNPVRILEIDTAAGTATSTVYAPQTDTHYPAFRTSTDGLSFLR